MINGRSINIAVVEGNAAGEARESPKIGDGIFACLLCGATLNGAYLRSEGKAQRLGLRLTAVATEVKGRRRYRVPTAAEIQAAEQVVVSADFASVPINPGGQGIRVGLYGMQTWEALYTRRQLLLLSTFSDLIATVPDRVMADGGDAQWAKAVTTLLGLALGGLATASSTQTRWRDREAESKAEPAFGRNDLPMTWDFAETYFASSAVGDWLSIARRVATTAARFAPVGRGVVVRADARTSRLEQPALVATDPPYFDAIGYADLSDFFYVWHRRALKSLHPDLYATLAAPKTGELTAVSAHHGNSKMAARDYFIAGFTDTFQNLQASLAPGLPMLVVYASKEQKATRQEETRWSSILTAMIDGNLEITGTWPVHGTGGNRMVGLGTNAVASYVAMVCRPRAQSAGSCSLGDFNRALRRELRPAVRAFQAAGILPVDLAQAAMGPGMQVFSRYREVVDQSRRRVTVEHALGMINSALGEVLDEQEGELDSYSRFAVAWWDRHGWDSASFGMADQLARPQGTSVDDIVRSGVACYPIPGYVALLGAGELKRDWTPANDTRPTAWEAVHHLADRLIDGGGAVEAARLMSEFGTFRDPVQALIYRLHDIAARKGRAKDQERYNALIGSWSDLIALSATEKNGLF